MPRAPHNIYRGSRARDFFCLFSLPLFLFFFFFQLLTPPPAAPGIPKYEPAAINSSKDMPPSCHPAVLGEGRAGGQPGGSRAGFGQGGGRCLYPPALPPASATRLHSHPPGAGDEPGLLEDSGKSSSSASPRRVGRGGSGLGTWRPLHARCRAAVGRGGCGGSSRPPSGMPGHPPGCPVRSSSAPGCPGAAPAPVRGYSG